MGPGESRVFIKQNCELDNPSLPGSFGADLQFGLPHFSHWSLLFHHLHVKTLKGTKQRLPICLEFKGKRESHHAKVEKNKKKNKLDLYILPKHFKNSSKHNTTQLSDICLTCFFGFFFSESVGWKKILHKWMWVITLSVDHPSVQYSGHRAALLVIELQSHPLSQEDNQWERTTQVW